MLNLGGAGGLLINLVVEVVQDFVRQQSLHVLAATINNEIYACMRGPVHVKYARKTGLLMRCYTRVPAHVSSPLTFTAHCPAKNLSGTLAPLGLLSALPHVKSSMRQVV